MTQTQAPFINAATPFLRKTPTSLVSQEWIRVLNFLLQSAEGNVSNQTELKWFQPSPLGTSATVIATVPSKNPITNQLLGTSVYVGGQVRLTNTSTSSVAVTLYAVPSENNAGAGNECLPGVSVAANSNLDVNLPKMWAGDQLVALAGTANVVTIHDMAGTIYGQ